MPTASMIELLEAGVHFGHQTQRWNPKMKPYIYGARNGIYVIDLRKTTDLLDEAYNLVRDYAAKGKNVLFVGAVWAVWHMPMWIIRNSLGMEQIVYLCIWTLLVSVVLGITYYQCRNILLIAIMHAIFNICYLAPIQYNIVVLAIIIFVGTLLYKKSGKKLFTW